MMDKLFNCPCVIDVTEQDCGFPDCEGGWEAVYRKMDNRIKELESKLSEYENKLEMDKETAKKIATEFYYWWHNQPGANTEQGFDKWWEARTTLKKMED